MDLTSLKEAAANLTIYDLKAGVRKVQNAVMNYTEMEAKVREATNNEPWGASSSMMQDIANGTYNYQNLNEIMPIIYKRFTEKAADEWRQIYKALQLLEFLIKNGSERVIDDARSHLTLLKMLRQFHYVDQNGKDQGLNVRNRAKELTELLSDVDRIRAERKKARSTKSKYTGVAGGIGSSGGSRFGGFGGNESSSGAAYGGYSGGVYGDGGGYGGQQSDFQDFSSHRTSAGGRDRFEEYDEFTEGSSSTTRKNNEVSASSPIKRKNTEKNIKKSEPIKKTEPEVDLFSFDDIGTVAPASVAPLTSTYLDDEDDFDEFQSAAPSVLAPAPFLPPAVSNVTTTSTIQLTSPQPLSASNTASLSDLANLSTFPQFQGTSPTLNKSTVLHPDLQQSKSTGFQNSQPNYFASVQITSNNPKITSSTVASGKSQSSNNILKTNSQEDAFGSLWSSASAGLKKTNTPTTSVALGKLAKEKASAGIWSTTSYSNTNPAPQTSQTRQQQSSGLGDLLG
ncbi:ENTH domain-containing protein [Erysiphe neolycopersici]|uniref:ENTH domain-containing protein n=1 Tax=Erysiphe neolycopersici TaxID=212602 RepID=A0A420HTB6_9PEZI|nr:ENTH domain-containing protein [Erysiphe neolycopersici]